MERQLTAPAFLSNIPGITEIWHWASNQIYTSASVHEMTWETNAALTPLSSHLYPTLHPLLQP